MVHHLRSAQGHFMLNCSLFLFDGNDLLLIAALVSDCLIGADFGNELT